jgi:hypothetical protein
VLWGWSDEPLRPTDCERLTALQDALLAGSLDEELTLHLTAAERRALSRRVQSLLRSRTMPDPSGRWPSIPWPAF